jgi:osmotically-inducible protein OsmY
MKKIAVVVLTFVCFAAGSVFAAPESDPELGARVSALLTEIFGDDAATIQVTVTGTEAVLSGKVTERSTQELAEEVALACAGIKSVDNRLESTKEKPALHGQLLGEGEDAMLEMEVKSALASEIGKHAKEIEVEAADGMVTIRGAVPDEARLKFALDAASTVKGVKRVIDLLHVRE